MVCKILQKTAGMNAGGIEKLLINIQEKINKEIFEFDYYLNDNNQHFYTDKIIEYGGNIYAPETSNHRILNIFNRIIKFYKFLKYNKYDILHINEDLLASAVYVLIGKMNGIPNIIVHSHNDYSVNKINCFKQIMNWIARKIILTYGNYYFACSDVAAKFFFGKSIETNKRYFRIANGIDTKKYAYDYKICNDIREELNIKNKFVVGHVGRFFEQKNHKFLIDIFKEILTLEPEAVLLLIGDGPLKSEIMERIVNLNMIDKVKFLGVRKDVPELMMAMDVFVLPSFHEGLPVVCVEAQASGLNCVVSTSITKEVNFGLCQYLKLSDSAKDWALNILKYKNRVIEREKCINLVIKAGFDINLVIAWLEEFYLNIYKSKNNQKDYYKYSL